MLYLWTRKLITSSAFRNYLSQERSSIADNELDPTENKKNKISKGVVTDHWHCLLRRFNLVEIFISVTMAMHALYFSFLPAILILVNSDDFELFNLPTGHSDTEFR